MMTLLFILLGGLVGYGAKKAHDYSYSYEPSRLALPAPVSQEPMVRATLTLDFSAVPNGTNYQTTATVFFELNRAGSSCSSLVLETAREELQALGGLTMLRWATYYPYDNPLEELIDRFGKIKSDIVPLSRVIVVSTKGMPPRREANRKMLLLSPGEEDISRFNALNFSLDQLQEAIYESQKQYPELWDDDDTRSVLEKRIADIRGSILTGRAPKQSYRSFRNGASSDDL